MMEGTNEIKSLGGGRFSFWVGQQRYIVTTELEPERFCVIAKNVSELVASFPHNLNQDERLFLALMTVVFQLEEAERRINKLRSKMSGEEAQ